MMLLAVPNARVEMIGGPYPACDRVVYNGAIWQAQVAAYPLGVLALLAALRPGLVSDRLVLSVLAGMWVWTGTLHHGAFFSTNNEVAVPFGSASGCRATCSS
jgi:hypothetical protein